MDRSYILDRIKSKSMSIEEFNFDKLSAPPLAAFLTPYDIADLRAIATSIKLSSKPEEKYKLIDQIMKRRGLTKFAGGTNRIVYRHPEFNNILFKIAIDNIGMGDNPAEFRNQFLLKPFVAKTFEISPCGTVAIQERLEPIRSREEYMYIAEDVYTLLTEWIIGRYIMADIGAAFFMNVGIRKGFGVCILDYPYLYELDGAKLYCRAPDPKSPSGHCDGIIDYDDGFNFLRCSKCGVKYKAKELAKQVDSKLITLSKEGESKMKVRTKGGTGVTVQQNNKKFNNDKKGNSNDVITKEPVKKINNSIKDYTDNCPKVSIDDVKEISGFDDSGVKEAYETYKSVTEEVVPGSVAGSTNKAKSPVSFSDDKPKNENNDGKSYVYEIEQALETIKNNINKIKIDQIKDDILGKITDTVISITDGEILLSKAFDYLNPEDAARFGLYYARTNLAELEAEDLNDVLNSEDFTEIVKTYVEPRIFVSYLGAESDTFNIRSYLVNPFNEENEDEETLEPTTYYNLYEEEVANGNDNFPPEYEEDDEDSNEFEVTDDDPADNSISSTPVYCTASLIDIKDVISDQPSAEILVIEDNNYGGYFTDADGRLIAIDRINDKDVSDITVTSKTWLDNVVKELEDLKGEHIVMEDENPDMVKALEKANIPVGALAAE